MLALSDAVRAVLGRVESDRDEGEEDFVELRAEIAAFCPEPKSARSAPAAPLEDPPPAPSVEVEPPAPAAELTPPLEDPEPPERGETGPETVLGGEDRTVRLDVDLLDRLMDTVGELVLVRNQLQRETSSRNDAILMAASQRLGFITSELQEQVMKTRMQPISHLWNKLPRYVRDVAQSCQKEVVFETEGDDTELDRSVLQAIGDPLVHLIRNAIDHGLERPEERRSQGKPAHGTLRLRAFHEGGYVHVVVSDDGRGIDPAALARRAVEAGFLGSAQVERLSDRELLQLAFRPGISTANRVTNLSGRGVGLDVVKTNIELIGGSIEIDSPLRRGTTFAMRIPLTLAIVPALLVTSAQERYAIPQANLQELVCLKPEEVEYIDQAPFHRLRDVLLPLVDLAGALQLGSSKHVRTEEVNVVVVQHDAGSFGLIVEHIGDTEEIVVKPLGRQLRHLSLYAGATVLGDGRVSLILDVAGIGRHCELAVISSEGLGRGASVAQATSNEQPYLLLRERGGGVLALQLSSVARLEEFSRDEVELAGGGMLVQYRGQILRLLFLEDLLFAESQSDLAASGYSTRQPRAPRSIAEVDTLSVVVYESAGQLVGVVVDEVTDIVSTDLSTCDSGPSTRPGVSSTAVINGQIAEVLDLEILLAKADSRPLLSWSGA
ncbi:MAG: chemotaxis protein CheA [Planctomycetes bacterium]|nr:chemotaxis protein CheA [Planctomycetota bacterium]